MIVNSLNLSYLGSKWVNKYDISGMATDSIILGITYINISLQSTKLIFILSISALASDSEVIIKSGDFVSSIFQIVETCFNLLCLL